MCAVRESGVFFFQAEDGIRDVAVTGVQTCALPISPFRGGLVLVAPNGGESWTVGSTQAITWTTAGTIANVKLEYSTDGGVTYPSVVAASVPNTGSFSWTIPDSISNTVRVRVSDVTDASANDTSDGNFKIRGNLTVTTPNGGEVVTLGAAQTITWTSAGTIPSVKLEYSKDNFATVTLIAASVGNTGSFAWTVPDNASTTVKVRVTNTADATVFDDSNANFTIRRGFILSAPNAGEEWVVGSTHQIAWTTTGSRSEEHTSELQSRLHLVCRLLLEKK